MAITESEMRALREMFLDAARSLLESERKMLREIVSPVEGQLATIEKHLVELERRMGLVEAELSQLVRIERVERRLEAVEEKVRASGGGR